MIEILLLSALAWGGVTQQDAPPQYSTTVALMDGIWLLNESLSQDPREVMQQAMRQGGRGRRGAGGGRGGMGGGSGGGGGGRGGMGGGSGGGGGGRGGMGGGRGERPDGAGGFARGWAFTERVEIKTEESGLTMKNHSGNARFLRVDGTWGEYKLPDGNRAEVKSEWSSGKLVVTTRMERNGTEVENVELWEVLPEAGRLVLTVQLQMPGQQETVAVRRVFDRADKEE